MSISNNELREALDVSMEKSLITGNLIFTMQCTACDHLCELRFCNQTRLPFAVLGKLGGVLFLHCKRLEKEKAVQEKKQSGQHLLTLTASEVAS